MEPEVYPRSSRLPKSCTAEGIELRIYYLTTFYCFGSRISRLCLDVSRKKKLYRMVSLTLSYYNNVVEIS